MILLAMKFLAILVMITSPLFVLAQTDTLVLSNGDVIVGEIKDMTRGVLTLETDYSDFRFQDRMGEGKRTAKQGAVHGEPLRPKHLYKCQVNRSGTGLCDD